MNTYGEPYPRNTACCLPVHGPTEYSKAGMNSSIRRKIRPMVPAHGASPSRRIDADLPRAHSDISPIKGRRQDGTQVPLASIGSLTAISSTF